MPFFNINYYLTSQRNEGIPIFVFMQFTFYKYHGTGNDFVLIDNRNLFFPKENSEFIAHLCHRRFGIGADGLILLENHQTSDFEMVYFNSDGNRSSMCGNGGRCIVHFARYLNLIENSTEFHAIDGFHQATLVENRISLKMNDVKSISVHPDFVYLNTGSPHHVELVSQVNNFDVFTHGKDIRQNKYGSEGANVNFVEPLSSDEFYVRTYERGVEDETLSCGTGVTAVALAMFELGKTKSNKVKIQTPGGKLKVSFKKNEEIYTEIYLEGPAEQIFKGKWK